MDMEPASQSTETMDEPEDAVVGKSTNSISLPDGLKTPEGHADGDTFQGTFRGYIKDGKLCFRSINNIPLSEAEGDESEADESTETVEEESNEESMGIEKEMDDDDREWMRKEKENNAFKKAFQS